MRRYFWPCLLTIGVSNSKIGQDLRLKTFHLECLCVGLMIIPQDMKKSMNNKMHIMVLENYLKFNCFANKGFTRQNDIAKYAAQGRKWCDLGE